MALTRPSITNSASRLGDSCGDGEVRGARTAGDADKHDRSRDQPGANCLHACKLTEHSAKVLAGSEKLAPLAGDTF